MNIEDGGVSLTINGGELVVAARNLDGPVALDAPARQGEVAFVSHAHEDHVTLAGGPGCVAPRKFLLSPATRALVEMRRGPGCWTATAGTGEDPPVFMHELGTGNAARACMVPSGHVLGATALHVGYGDAGEACLTYTGDFLPSRGRLLPPLQPRPCGILATECTFGLPGFEFPPFPLVEGEILDWVEDALGKGPVIIHGHALGKTQELLWMLGKRDLGVPVVLDDLAWKFSSAYTAEGITLPACMPYSAWSRGKHFERVGRWILVLPWRARFDARYRRLDAIPHARAICSGWALVPGWVDRFDVDAAFPLSDHPCFSELIAFIEACAPRHVVLVHGNGAVTRRALLERARDEVAGALARDARVHALKVA